MKIRYIIIGNMPGKDAPDHTKRFGGEYKTVRAARAARTRLWKRQRKLSLTILGTAKFAH